VFNIQKAVSRLEFAPDLKEIHVTDVKRGLAEFVPRPDKPASFGAIKGALKKAGYELASAEITAIGTLERDGSGWSLSLAPSGQRFALVSGPASQSIASLAPGTRVEVSGTWTTVGEKNASREVITPTTVSTVSEPVAATGPPGAGAGSFVAPPPAPLGPFLSALAPIRATSPGLTVYKGGAVTIRYSHTSQHLGDLAVDRNAVKLAASYTPTPRIQLEADVPIGRTSFDDQTASGSGGGFGNVTLWAKYRFFRTLETWGDRQASARFGLELPTGDPDAPSERSLAAPAYVREQLSSIDGGLAVRGDVAYSQARGRFVFGGNVEGVLRTERGGYRLGRELRVNTDLELVALPIRYEQPGHELFFIVETTLVLRDEGRSGGHEVAGSRSAEYFVAPALQFVASPRLVFEASVQWPIFHDTGPLALRTDRNILVGFRYLF
jgi:hypothetical protein